MAPPRHSAARRNRQGERGARAVLVAAGIFPAETQRRRESVEKTKTGLGRMRDHAPSGRRGAEEHLGENRRAARRFREIAMQREHREEHNEVERAKRMGAVGGPRRSPF